MRGFESNFKFSQCDSSSLTSFCVLQPFCSLHLHLHMSENPYTSGNIISKETAPGIIIASGEDITRSALGFFRSEQRLSELMFTKWNQTNLSFISVLCHRRGKKKKYVSFLSEEILEFVASMFALS